MTITRINPTQRFSDATIHNGVIYTVEVPSVDGDIQTQTHNVFDNIQHTLQRNGSSLRHLLMVTIYLTDMADYDAMNQIWDERIPSGCAPVRACLQIAKLARPQYKIEMVVTAALSAM